MKKKKLIAILGIALVGNYFVTFNCANLAFAEPLKPMNVVNQSESELSNTHITFYNIWWGTSVDLGFNTKDMKFDAERKSGNLGNGQNAYMQLFLYNSKENKIELNKSIIDGSSTNLADVLNNKSFNYGDIIGIKFEDGAPAPLMSNGERINNDGKMHYFTITKSGLVPYTPSIEVNPFSILTGGKVTEGNLQGKASPNTKVTVKVNNDEFTGTTNKDGIFDINVKDLNGFTENTNIQVVMMSKVGEITKTIKPTLSSNVSIDDSKINVINWWGSLAGTITFNPLTGKIDVSGYNQFLGSRNNKTFLNITISDPSTGQVLLNSNINGTSNTNALKDALNEQNFKYGDIITLKYDRAAGAINILNKNQEVGNNTGNIESFEITEDGLIQSNLQKINVNSLNILGDGEVNVTKGVVTGQANPNQQVNVLVNGQTFTGTADNSGNFKINIEDNNGFTLDTPIIVTSKGRLLTEITPSIDSAVKIQNSAIQINNGWGSNAGRITFNPVNMQLNVSQYNAYLGHNEKEFMNFKIYNPTTNQVLEEKSFKGNENTSALSNLLNGKTFEYGNVIEISYDSNQGRISVLNGNENVADSSKNNQYFQITKEGLVKVVPDVSINPFNILTGNKVIKGNVTGTAKPNSAITINFDNQSFMGKSNKKGEFSIPIEDTNGFTENTNIEVKIPSQIGEITKNIKPSLSTDVKLNTSKIQVLNYWGGVSGDITFNPLTKEISATGNSGYLGSTWNHTFMKITITDPRTGEVLINSDLNGASNSQALIKALNGRKFNYGDIITLQYNSGAGKVQVLNANENIGNTTGEMESFEITEGGLVKGTLKPVKVNNFDILGEGTVNVQKGILTGEAEPNAEVNVFVNGKEFTGKANTQGKFNIELSDSTGFNVDTNILVSTKDRNITEINPTINNNVKIQNSAIQINNGWGSDAGKITFNPLNMTLNISQYNAYLGHNGNDFLNIKVYNPSNNSVVAEGNLKGNMNTSALTNLLNTKQFEYGDIVQIAYDSSQGKVTTLNGATTISKANGNTQYFKITKGGLEEVNLNSFLYPFTVLTGNKVTEGNVTGKANPNSEVTVNFNNKVYTGKADSEGNFSIKIQDSDGFTQDMNIEVHINSNVGKIIENVKPTLSPNVKLNSSKIQIINAWGGVSRTIAFNPINKQFEVTNNSGYLASTSGSDFLSMQVLNPTTGEIVFNTELNANSMSQELTKILNGKQFDYGDVITLKYSNNGKVQVLNGEKNIGNMNGSIESFAITEGGLVKADLKPVQVNKFDILGNGEADVKEGTLTGVANPNSDVNVLVDGNLISGKADKKGNFSIKLSDAKGFTENTKILVSAQNRLITEINPTINNQVTLQNEDIKIVDKWGTCTGGIKFNPITMNFSVYENYSQLYLSNGTYINIEVANPITGKISSSVGLDSNSNTSVLSEGFNNKTFQYGDVIKVSSNQNNEVSIINNGQTKKVDNTTKYYEITKEGLKPFTQTLEINPFAILNGGEQKEGTLTGKSLPNSNVIINVDNKEFETVTDNEGKFKINLTDNNGFTGYTPVNVWVKGCVPQVVYPVAASNVLIGKETLKLNDNSLGVAQTITFNPTTMKISNSGSGVAVQVMDKDTGKITASLGNSNFNVFTSKNDLNGATFKYGDLISLYESKETYLSDKYMMLIDSNGATTNIDAVEQFKTFVITPQGLVPIKNKNLSDVSAIFEGNSAVAVQGKTIPNANVQLFYGNDKNISVKADGNGEFKTTIPISEAGIGSEVRVFINNENAQNVIVKYDSKIFDTDNSIQIINNEAFPVINMTFNPAEQKINAMVYPRDKTYAGIFYGNKINISLINPKTGEVLKYVTSNKPSEIESFANELNNLSYTLGDIIKIQYDNSFVSADVLQNKKEIGNNTGEAEYFELNSGGLVNVTNKFIETSPFNILGAGKVTEGNITGKIAPNEKVTATVDGKEFTGTSDANGSFTIKVEDANGFTNNTVITLGADGYIPTNMRPGLEKNLGLSNSYINLYQNSINWETSGIFSSIGFNVENSTFYVDNYKNGFTNGPSNNFNIYLYNGDGKEVYNQSFGNNSEETLYKAMNGRKFNYGDIIGISFNPSAYKPVILNGTNTLGNVTGKMEYFEITKNGLVGVNFGEQAQTTNVVWNNGDLQVTANMAKGNSSELLNGNKQIVLLDPNNKVIAFENATTTSKDGVYTVAGTLTKADLSKISENEKYTIGLEVKGQVIPVYIGCNTPSSNEYVLSGTDSNKLEINLKAKPYVTISNSNEINNYLNSINNDLNNVNVASLASNTTMQNKVLVAEFINRIGLKNIENFYSKSTENANFLNWVLNNSIAMEEFLNGPNPEGPHTPEGQPTATYEQCLQVWSNIWNTYTNSHYGFNLKLAIATALTNGSEISSFPSGKPVGSPVERYNIFETLNEEGQMLPIFSTLDVSHLCYVTNVGIANNEIMQMRNIILQNHNGLITENLLNNVAYTIHYNVNNPHTGVSVFNGNFYGPNPTISTVWYDGGVCGATGRMGAFGEQVFGIPAVQTPQPGHNAFIYYNAESGQWQIGNAVDGWSNTYDADMSTWSNSLAKNNNIASYTLLYQKADTETLAKSNMYIYLANAQSGYSEKVQDLNKAIEVNPLNLGAWIQLVNLYTTNSNTTIDQYNTLVKNAISTFKDYPMPMYDLLLKLRNVYAEKGTQQDFNNYVNAIKNGLNESSQKSIANPLLAQMKSDGLDSGSYEGLKNANVLKGYDIQINNVWNQALGTISFNGQTQKLQFSKGWSLTNPYASGKDFTISLENKEGQVLKSVEIKFGEYPEEALNEAFNNLSFNYGDKLVINYDSSNKATKFNLSKVYTENGLTDNYKLNESTTIYINRGGLSLVQDFSSLKGNIIVTMKTADGNVIGTTTTLTGQLNTKVIANNINVPEGYILKEVENNGKVIYEGSSIENAEYIISQLDYQKENINLTFILSKN